MAGITVKIRSSTGSTFEIEIEPDALTVYELKELLTKSIPGTIAADLRLVYSGRILKDPEEVSSYSKLHSSIMYKAHHLA
jgi:ubiquilin